MVLITPPLGSKPLRPVLIQNVIQLQSEKYKEKFDCAFFQAIIGICDFWLMWKSDKIAKKP